MMANGRCPLEPASSDADGSQEIYGTAGKGLVSFGGDRLASLSHLADGVAANGDAVTADKFRQTADRHYFAKRGTRNSLLASPSATRAVLDEFGIAPKKSLGQNFLIDDNVIGKILTLADVGRGDLVLEVGPGIGTLTLALLDNAGGVISIERDATLYPVLRQTVGAIPRFALIEVDALDVSKDDIRGAAAQIGSWAKSFGVSQASLPSMPTAFVANLPYAVAATVILGYLERFGFLRSATVMVQREVADRIAAVPGSKDYGAYTVALGLIVRVAGRFDVSPESFMPPPHVISTIIRLERRIPLCADGTPATPRLIKAATFAAKAAFAQRRKTIRNSMRAYLASAGRDASSLDAALAQAAIAPGIRGEMLAQEQFIQLGQALIDHRMAD